jgi:AmmeMemoRadiSam system protein B
MEVERSPAVAGQFYPGEAKAMERALDTHLAAGDPDAGVVGCRALLLPHAGWMYSGDTAGRTVARARVPATAVVLGPKHTPFGPPASAASHERWSFPGGAVEVDAALRDAFVSRAPGVTAEPEAHRYEHGAEVVIPFLRRANPDLRIVPLALGVAGFEDTRELAEALAEVVSGTADPPLLVVSSDLNHFAPEPENRRRDLLALEAFEAGDARRLWKVCRDEDVSMCGLAPAVTVLQALTLAYGSCRGERVDYTNSAAVSGDLSRVVGYGGVIVR